MQDLNFMGRKAKEASRILSHADTAQKNEALRRMAAALLENTAHILSENEKDLAKAREKGISDALLDRLALSEEKIRGIARDMEKITTLLDPVGETVEAFSGAEGIEVEKVRVPMGVIAIIYESRPNVTADAAALCIKTGNAVLLKGGSDALSSNLAIAEALRQGLAAAGLPEDGVQLLASTDRETATKLMRLRDYVDLLIPRGGAGLIRNVVENATVPVIETGTGNCHLYVDEYADVEKALPILVNGKTQRPGVCNALETLLVHENIASVFLPRALTALSEKGVEIRGCEKTRALFPCKEATEEDFATEFLDLVLSVRVVPSLDEAICHIGKYSTLHSEAIVTENEENANRFLEKVDAAAVYVNASTRFTDGGMFGFGAEIGISTQKLHARGPMGLPALTTYKYKIRGNGQVRK